MANIDIKKFLDENGLEHLIGILKNKFNDVEGKIPTDFYSKSEVDDAIANAKSQIIGGAGQDYDTLKEIETWVLAHQDLYTALVTTVGEKAAKSYVDEELALKADKSNTYTKQEVDAAIKVTDDKLADYAKKTEVTQEIEDATDDMATMTWAEGQFLKEHQSLEEYAKSADVTSEIEEAISKITAISNEEISALFE